jgi:hypothetical protein
MLLVPACALAVAFGCGPMRAPLPERLGPEMQKQIDDAWTGILTPPNRLGRQDLLDVLVGTFAYQHGVDTLTLRTSKQYAGGTGVMEAQYDRTRPTEDRFDVTVYGLDGKIERQERYTRNELDETFDSLFRSSPDESGERNEATNRRWEKILSHFPKPEERKAEEAPKPRQKG